MRACLLTGYGGPEKLEYREDVPEPVPSRGEVLVKVGAAGLNNTDIWTRQGAYGTPGQPQSWRGEPLSFPRIQGADIAGQITAVGATVPTSRIGERVLIDSTIYSENGDGPTGAGLIGSERDGGFAEFVTVPAENAHPVNSDLSDVELASFPTAYVTAERMLNRAKIGATDTILVTGASGGVGSALVQLAKLRSATVIAVVAAEKEEHVRAIGADATVPRGRQLSTIRDATATETIDAIADVVGGPHIQDLLQLLRPGGRYVIAGAIAGPIVTIDLRTIYLNHLNILGSTMGSRYDFAALLGYIDTKQIQPLVWKTYPLRELARAQEDFQRKAFFGKLVLTPN
jgi:NADPH:quinone reductase-like Zn-dependent oxidoreductase